jgi:signal transduction histidine kinase
MKLENQKVEDLYTLITYVNHELRNPLNVLLSLINISIRLIKNILNSPNSHSTDKLTDILIDILGKLEITHGSNYSVMTIINDVSELKHIRNGTIKINMDVISLESIGTKTIHSLQYKLDENKYLMTLEYVNTDPDFLIYADPVRINQILINFITNAIVHAKSKVIYFSIYREHSKIYFKVRDIGVGISPIIQSKIFKEKFIQNNVIDQAMRIGGVGIGLYICYHVAKAIGADVDFVSDDTGTTFWLCIDENKVKIPKNISLDV